MIFHPIVHRLCLEVFTQTVVSCKKVVPHSELPSAVAARGLALQEHLWTFSGRATGARCRGSGGAGLASAACRCCSLAKGAACAQPSKGTIQPGSARRIPSRCVCFGAMPSFALPHLFHTGAGPLIISGYWVSGVTFNGFGC